MLSGRAAEALAACRDVARELSPKSLGLHLHHEAHKITAHTSLVIATALGGARRDMLVDSGIAGVDLASDPLPEVMPPPVRLADDVYTAATTDLTSQWKHGVLRPASPHSLPKPSVHTATESTPCDQTNILTDDLIAARIGLAAVAQMLENPVLPSVPNEFSEVLELKAELLLQNCDCPVDTRVDARQCTCGAIEGALAALQVHALLSLTPHPKHNDHPWLTVMCAHLQAGVDLCEKGEKRTNERNTRRPQLNRRARLRALQGRMGLIDHEAEAAAEAALEQLRTDRREHVTRRKGRRMGAHATRLETLAPGIAKWRKFFPLCKAECAPQSGLTCTLADLPPPPALDWDRVPIGLQPGSEGEGGLAHNQYRVTRKRWQLESLYRVLDRVVAMYEHTHGGGKNSDSSPPAPESGCTLEGGLAGGKSNRCVIVDFGAGSGNSALCYASLFPQCHFILVDHNPVAVKLGRVRVETAGLSNAEVRLSSSPSMVCICMSSVHQRAHLLSDFIPTVVVWRRGGV